MNKTSVRESAATHIRGAAEYIGVSPAIVLQKLHSGEIAAVRCGKRWIIPYASLDRFLGQITNQTAQTEDHNIQRNQTD